MVVSRGRIPTTRWRRRSRRPQRIHLPTRPELIAYFEGRKEREEYGRYGNPSVRLVEEKLAALERTEDAVAFASGMAAVTSTILALVKSGSHVILFADCYRRTRQFVTTFLDRFGISSTLIPPADVDALRTAIRPETRLVIAEAPTNPYQTIPDLDQVAEICREKKVKTARRQHVCDASQLQACAPWHRHRRAQRHEVSGRPQRCTWGRSGGEGRPRLPGSRSP